MNIETTSQTHTKPSSSQNVWKVGSRWSHTGTVESSIIDLFRRNNIVFTNRNTHLFERIKEGDLIAVSDGFKIIALGLATSSPKPITQFTIQISSKESEIFSPDDSTWGCKISFIDLKEQDYFTYKKRGAFHGIPGDNRNKLITIHDEYKEYFQKKQSFEINARSCTLLHNNQNPNDILWRPNNTLKVPVYQRAYAWEEPEVKRLLNDLLASFFGRNGRAIEEPMFVGTVQLSAPVPTEESQTSTQQDIIDGQQRSTTLILILKALQLLHPKLPLWNEDVIFNDRLVTSVSGGVMQRYLDRALDCKAESRPDDELNIYLLRLKFILEELAADNDLLSPETEHSQINSNVTSFAKYLCSQVYFVVIETRANLSKTLQIFDSINTSGMDLNGGDIFKVRYYDYLRETIPDSTEKIFEKVCQLYEKIDRNNQESGKRIVSMEDVLRVAQQIIISEADLSVSNRSLAGTTFFERFFDTMLDVNRWEGLHRDTCCKVQLTIDKLNYIIDLLFEWHNTDYSNLSAETQALSHFIWYSRYGRYYVVQHVFRYAYNPSVEELESFIAEFSKLLSIYSVTNKKAVSQCHTLVASIMKNMLNPEFKLPLNELLSFIRSHRHNLKDPIEDALNTHAFAHIPRAKNLLLRMDAMLDELKTPKNNAKTLHEILFDTRIDIEHIESANHENLAEREKIHKEWGNKLHQLGNLIVLEFDINRSISNGSYEEIKRPRYKESKFISVIELANNTPSWSLEMMQIRHKQLVSRLTQYLSN